MAPSATGAAQGNRIRNRRNQRPLNGLARECESIAAQTTTIACESSVNTTVSRSASLNRVVPLAAEVVQADPVAGQRTGGRVREAEVDRQHEGRADEQRMKMTAGEMSAAASTRRLSKTSAPRLLKLRWGTATTVRLLVRCWRRILVRSAALRDG